LAEHLEMCKDFREGIQSSTEQLVLRKLQKMVEESKKAKNN
jgi:hypothetical protein